MSDTPAAPHIRAGKPGEKLSLGNYAEDLRNAYANANGDADPWRAVARRALELAPRVLPEPAH